MTTYAVLGAGRQGTAAAYDMARWGNADRVLIADVDRGGGNARGGASGCLDRVVDRTSLPRSMCATSTR